MKVLIVAGGTGGHLYPGISVAKALTALQAEVLLLIRDQKWEREVVSAYQLPFRTIAGTGLRKSPIGFCKFCFGFVRGYRQAGRIIDEFRPEVTLAMGNYLSLSAALASRRRGIPIILHEQNCLPGKATKMLARWAKVICISFPETAGYLSQFRDRITVTGNPLRQEMMDNEGKTTARPSKTLLIFGGSQGAHGLNLVMLEALDHLEELRKNMKIIHLTGKADLELVEQGYREKNFEVLIAPYENKMHEVYRQADLVLSRAGALTLAELAYFGLPSILIPYPHAAEDHQLVNARVFEQAGAARILLQREANGETLARHIAALLKNEEQLQSMGRRARTLARPQAAADIVKIILGSIQK